MLGDEQMRVHQQDELKDDMVGLSCRQHKWV